MIHNKKNVDTMAFDIAVVGGGLSGVCAAVGAAQSKKSVLLIEKYGFLGGMTTAAFFTPWQLQGSFEDCGRIGAEVLSSLEAMNGFRVRSGRTAVDLESLKFVLQEMLLRHDVALLLHSQCCGFEKKDTSILSLELQCREGKVAVAAKQFVDATGISALAGWADVSVRQEQSALSYRFMMTGVRDGEISEPRTNRLAEKWFGMHPHLSKGCWDIAPAIRDGEVVVGIIHYDGTGGSDARRLIETRAPQLVAEAESFLRREVDEFRSASVLAVPAQIGLHAARTMHAVSRVTKLPDILETKAGVYDHAMRQTGMQNLFITGRNILDPQILSTTNNPQASMILGERAGVLAVLSLS